MLCLIRRDQRGIALILMVICILALLGITALVVDLGRLYVAKQRAQNVADSAAMGGGWLLQGPTQPTDPAQQVAEALIQANNGKTTNWKVTEPVISFPTGEFTLADGTVKTLEAGEAIRVHCKVPVEFTFAKIFGDSSGNAPATAVVILDAAQFLNVELAPLPAPAGDAESAGVWIDGDPAKGLSYVPVDPGLPADENNGTVVRLKIADPKDPEGFFGSGNFLPIQYEGDNGADDFYERLATVDRKDNPVDPVTVTVGDNLQADTKPGNMDGPTRKAMIARLGLDTVFTNDDTALADWLATYDPETNSCAETPRIMVVPIVLGGDLRGREELTVVGFAAFFVESFDPDTGIIQGRFITAMTNGEVVRYGTAPLGSGSSGSYPMTTPRLVK